MRFCASFFNWKQKKERAGGVRGNMKLSARRKYDYRDLEKIEAKHNSYASDMLFGEIAANWAIRPLKERAN
jgi:hypothetical protein